MYIASPAMYSCCDWQLETLAGCTEVQHPPSPPLFTPGNARFKFIANCIFSLLGRALELNVEVVNPRANVYTGCS